MKKVLIIAGSDSGGGAGIQADLKTLIARGVYGMSAITALTAQNTLGVHGVIEVDPEFVKKQIDTVMSDIGANVWKTGMLANEKIINLVTEKVIYYKITQLVLDPVMVAKSGDHLLKKEAVESLKKKLIPLSSVITPNRYEAEILSGVKINNLSDIYKNAEIIHQLGARNVIIKGGHLTKSLESVDLLYNGTTYTEFHSPRINTTNTHGTGCTFASAIAAELAKGLKIKKAVHIAKAYLNNALTNSRDLKIGYGTGPLDHSLGKISNVDLNTVRIIE